jgi:hypothetical protein
LESENKRKNAAAEVADRERVVHKQNCGNQVTKAQADVANEGRIMFSGLKSDVAELVIEPTRCVLQHELSDSEKVKDGQQGVKMFGKISLFEDKGGDIALCIDQNDYNTTIGCSIEFLEMGSKRKESFIFRRRENADKMVPGFCQQIVVIAAIIEYMALIPGYDFSMSCLWIPASIEFIKSKYFKFER